MSRDEKSTLAIVAFILFVDTLGFGLILPIMPYLISEITGTEVANAAAVGGYLLFAYAGMQFLFSPVIGGLSDRFGRRPVLLAALFLIGIDYVVMAVAPNLAWLFVGRIISGIAGATWPAANSCVADTISIDKRASVFGFIGGIGTVGYVLGPALGGVASEFGTRVPFAIAASLALTGSFVGFFLLKETLPIERRRQFYLTRANPFGSILQLAQTPFMLSFLAVVFFMQLATQSQLSIWAYWGQVRFGWTPSTSGLTVSVYGILIGIAQAVLTSASIRRFGLSLTAKYSLLIGVPSYLFLAFSPSIYIVILAIILGALTGMAFPALQTLMTARIGENEQGELQASIASTISLTSIVGPIIMTQIFTLYTDSTGVFFPGAPYIFSALFLSVAVAILFRSKSNYIVE
jgi:MFS transporter, DHA1 family, tetracycline resistance protein